MTRKIIDLFAGAGGLTTGFHMAGFESLCAIDIDAKALATYKHNYPNTKIIHQDIRQVNPSDLRLALGLQPEELTALIGGPHVKDSPEIFLLAIAISMILVTRCIRRFWILYRSSDPCTLSWRMYPKF